MPMFFIDNRERIHPVISQLEIVPETDWKIIGLSAGPRMESGH